MMDQFSKAILLKNLRDNQTAISLKYFADLLPDFNDDELAEVADAIIHRKIRSVEDGLHSVEMLKLLHKYT